MIVCERKTILDMRGPGSSQSRITYPGREEVFRYEREGRSKQHNSNILLTY